MTSYHVASKFSLSDVAGGGLLVVKHYYVRRGPDMHIICECSTYDEARQLADEMTAINNRKTKP